MQKMREKSAKKNCIFCDENCQIWANFNTLTLFWGKLAWGKKKFGASSSMPHMALSLNNIGFVSRQSTPLPVNAYFRTSFCLCLQGIHLIKN